MLKMSKFAQNQQVGGNVQEFSTAISLKMNKGAQMSKIQMSELS